MLIDRIHLFFRTRLDANDLARRASLESPVTLLGVRNVSEHEAFGVGRASSTTIRRSCWPVPTNFREPLGEAAGVQQLRHASSESALSPASPDDRYEPVYEAMGEPGGNIAPNVNGADAAAPTLQRMLVLSAVDMALPTPLDMNLRRLNLIRDHYRAVVTGELRLADASFTNTVMRPFVTWMQALTSLDEEQYGRCGQCAKNLLLAVVSTEFDGSVTVTRLGSIDHVVSLLDERATAAYFLDEIEPLLRDFHRVVANTGGGSVALESTTEPLSAPAR
ncbi:hypothetical protein [Pararobbsia alpina]|nr:hypothetical protein [Pararobbsia alpina]